ncbi:hypothetical protein SD71_05775 [Cohnella kolymensis]|uniref:DUF1802 family protein n=1 Tax=Cohnella kolymensis TaxID=1590652 RepID=A0ABR5A8M1_9BACL|nr:DUF1802 family protein [Cohnella kolymensis]KIL36762.1 hypothetical protein SD71_05775 [Cohnella kolymensis]
MEQPIALREWAAAVKALEEGRQVIVLRKGGIAEETKEFRLESPQFYLFPSFEHQKPHLVKDEAREDVVTTQAEAAGHPDTVTITSFAEVFEDIEITDADILKRLDPLHIWTEDYAEERLKWKRTKPLHVLVLRMYKLTPPAVLPLRENYGGCKSWLRLEDEIASERAIPVLSDDEFNKKARQVRNAIEGLQL